MRACEVCGGFVLREWESNRAVREVCINCGRDHTTPPRAPTALERDGTVVVRLPNGREGTRRARDGEIRVVTNA